MSYPARALASIANERQDDWRRQANEDRRFATTKRRTTISTATGIRHTLIGRLSMSGLRRRIGGASAEA